MVSQCVASRLRIRSATGSRSSRHTLTHTRRETLTLTLTPPHCHTVGCPQSIPHNAACHSDWPLAPLPHWPNVNPFGIIMRLLANILFAPHSRHSFAPLSLSSSGVTLAGGVINFYLLQQRVVSSAIMLAFSFYLAMSQTCTRCATGRLKQTDKGHKGAQGAQGERPKCAPMEFMGAN